MRVSLRPGPRHRCAGSLRRLRRRPALAAARDSAATRQARRLPRLRATRALPGAVRRGQA